MRHNESEHERKNKPCRSSETIGHEKKATERGTDIDESNRAVIEREMQWLESAIKCRVKEFFDNGENTEETAKDLSAPKPPELDKTDSHYSRFLTLCDLSAEERIVLMVALAPDIKPEVFDELSVDDYDTGEAFFEFGGVKSSHYRGFLPTIKTALFILVGNGVAEQLKYMHLFEKSGPLFAGNILKELPVDGIVPDTGRVLRLHDNVKSLVLTGRDISHEYSPDFPANRLTTELNWNDLVLNKATLEAIDELLAWVEHGDKLANDPYLGKRFQSGYRALFYGDPGTGKTLTASLLGKRARKPVYRIDLSRMISKYVGETEKNLERIFDTAEGRNWILFFDEADSLFGKRTGIDSANDRFANQETSYLLQRIETYSGLVILASNLKKNLDGAFTRRFQSTIHFPMPGENERRILWENYLKGGLQFDRTISLRKLANHLDISGASINNAMRYAALTTIAEGSKTVSKETLVRGLQKECRKIGRTFFLNKL